MIQKRGLILPTSLQAQHLRGAARRGALRHQRRERQADRRPPADGAAADHPEPRAEER